MEKTERFGLVLAPAEKTALQRLAELERLSAAAVVRRLIWREAKRLDTDRQAQPSDANRQQEVQRVQN